MGDKPALFVVVCGIINCNESNLYCCVRSNNFERQTSIANMGTWNDEFIIPIDDKSQTKIRIEIFKSRFLASNSYYAAIEPVSLQNLVHDVQTEGLFSLKEYPRQQLKLKLLYLDWRTTKEEVEEQGVSPTCNRLNWKSGFIKKQGGNHKTWKKRYFILSDGTLSYFRTPNDKEPLGVINLQNANCQISHLNDDAVSRIGRSNSVFTPSSSITVDRVMNMWRRPSSVRYDLSVDSPKLKYYFCVSASEEGSNTKRTYFMYTKDEDETRNWVDAISTEITRLQHVEADKDVRDIKKYENFEHLLLSSDHRTLLTLFDATSSNISDKVVLALLSLFGSHTSFLSLCKTAISMEVEVTSSAEVLFRRNSMASKLIAMCFRSNGHLYLVNTIQTYIDHICEDPKGFEIDPKKLEAELEANAEVNRAKALRENKKNLAKICQLILDNIIKSQQECPQIFRKILSYAAEESEKKFPRSKQLCVGGLIFLRFFCPAIVTPQLFGLREELPPADAQRILTLITKILLNLANGVEGVKKEEFMNSMDFFIYQNFDRVSDYLLGFADAHYDSFYDEDLDEPQALSSETRLSNFRELQNHFEDSEKKKKFNSSDEDVRRLYTSIMTSLQDVNI